ncbi:MAG TPA: hypothetical protein ACQGQX_01620 [Xylella taiwanensis]
MAYTIEAKYPWGWLLLATLALVDNVMAMDRLQMRAWEATLDAYVAAVRWSNFEGAEEMLDPAYRLTHSLTDLEHSRYAQVQVSSYRELRTSLQADGMVLREVEIGVVGRNSQAERKVRCTERWRWDTERKQWWLVSGLPDLWQGE